MKKLLLIIIFTISITPITGGKAMGFWNIFKAHSIYFGHQSVGKNLLDGIGKVTFSPGFRLHDFYVGVNKRPLSKIEAFEHHIKDNIKRGKRVDIAILKFCYVDLPNEQVTPKELFRNYKEMVDRLKQEYPGLHVAHMTIPLTSVKTNIKTYTKVMVNRLFGRYSNKNAIREEYNDLLRLEYGDAVFDIAMIESNQGEYIENGIIALCPHYTRDGGHLNETGKKKIATEFNNFLNGYIKTHGL